jgi:hypothetical protein
MKKFPALIPTLALLPLMIFLTTLNVANANSNEDNPLPFLPPFQHSQSQLQPSTQQHQQQLNQPPQKQPLNSNEMNNGHKNQFDNHSPTVTSVMPF